MIRTHVLGWFSNCRVWVWRSLTYKEWLVLPRVGKHIAVGKTLIAAGGIGLVCGGVIGSLIPLPPYPEWREWFSPAPFHVERFPAERVTDIPEPASFVLLGIGLAGVHMVRRKLAVSPR